MFGSCGDHRWTSIWELWPLPFHLDLELWPLQCHLRVRAVATTVPYELEAVAANNTFGLEFNFCFEIKMTGPRHLGF